MISWFASAFLVVGFIEIARRSRMVANAKQVFATSRVTLRVMKDADLSDDEKEKAVQQASVQSLGLFGRLILGGLAGVFLPLGIVWLLDLAGLLSLDAVLDVALSPTFLILATVLICLIVWLCATRGHGAAQYSNLDRLLHRFAFKSPSALLGMADIEDKLFAKQMVAVDDERPVFITALPRAGTTLLVETCAAVPELGAHTYRDMPFVLIPCLWNSLSGSFRKTGEQRERAHGDGMLIDYDSPEALEEMVWMPFWRQQYRDDRIVPWNDEHKEDFDSFFRSHTRKIASLHAASPDQSRYVSKNNGNIARTGVLRTMFPKSVILVPHRDPLQHAASLLTQHRNFLEIHREDQFASTYMRGIGHFDFGENLRPIDFGDWLSSREFESPEHIGFWIEYWIATYEYLLNRDDGLTFVGYEALCENPRDGLARLADAIGSRDAELLVKAADQIRSPTPKAIDTEGVPPALLARAEEVSARLRAASLI